MYKKLRWRLNSFSFKFIEISLPTKIRKTWSVVGFTLIGGFPVWGFPYKGWKPVHLINYLEPIYNVILFTYPYRYLYYL